MNKDDILRLEDISFSYGETDILKDFSLSVSAGSFTTLLGPSGCGKTTLLRLIAGFLKPQKGRIIMNGTDITGVPVEERHIGFVFQDYALFPHMTVKENLLFGFSGKEKKEHMKDLAETAASLDISDLLHRYPHELSGGQQQRVALGRTLMLKPRIILMDEPLSSLDAGLRLRVREELLEIQKKIGITTIYVTHDQEEALSLSDRIAVINRGKLLQYDSPENIYFNPADRETAAFTGIVNMLSLNGEKVMVRPEWIKFCGNREGPEKSETVIEGKVVSSSFLGAFIRYKVSCDFAEGGILTVDSAGKGPSAGEIVKMEILSSVCFEK